MDFASTKYEVADAFAFNELYQDNGWTDGLPIVPPTDALVRTFLGAARMAPGAVVAAEPVRRRRITAQKVAIAAVMAGCRPDCMPVVLTVIRALCDTRYGCTTCPRPLVAARRSSSSMVRSGTRSA